jgi:hypothetical protein
MFVGTASLMYYFYNNAPGVLYHESSATYAKAAALL